VPKLSLFKYICAHTRAREIAKKLKSKYNRTNMPVTQQTAKRYIFYSKYYEALDLSLSHLSVIGIKKFVSQDNELLHIFIPKIKRV
jgi:hypothetical protein